MTKEELIAGAGEPAGYAVPTFNFDNSVIQAVQYAGTEPLYTATQVAAAVAKAKQEYQDNLNSFAAGALLRKERIATLESALKAMLRIHTEPAGYEGKVGKEFDKFLELQIQKVDAAIATAKEALK